MQKKTIINTLTHTFLVACLWMVGLSGMTFTVGAQALTLEECILQALQNSHRIQVSDEAVKKVESQIKEAYGAASPELKLQTKWEWAVEQYNPYASGGGLDPSLFAFTQSEPFLDETNPSYHAPTAALAGDVGAILGSLGQALDFSSLLNDYQAQVSLIVTQILFAQGKISTGLDIAKEYKNILLAERQNIEMDLRKEVSIAFYQVLFLQEAIAIYIAGIDLAQQHLQQAQTMYNTGLASELDYLRAQLQVEDIQSGLQKMQKDLELAKNVLLNKMGQSYSTDVTIEGALLMPESLPDSSRSWQKAIDNRPDLKQLQYGKQMQEHLVKIARADFFPLIVAGGSLSKVGLGNDPMPQDWHTDARVFVQMEWKLWDGLQTKQKVAQQRTEVNTLNIQKVHAHKSIALQIESERSNMNDALQRIEVKKRMVALAEKAHSIATANFETGNATQLEVLSAQLDLRQARLNHLQSLLDLNIANISLQHALGEL